MQPISDDMDELFRSAADNYPLKINGQDWDSVAGRLEDGDEKEFYPLIVLPSSKTNNKNYRYLLLALLLPIGFLTAKYAGWIGGETITKDNAQKVSTAKTQPVESNPQKAAPNTNANDQKAATNITADNAVVNKTTAPALNQAAGTLTSGSKGVQNVAISQPGIGKKSAVSEMAAKQPNKFPLIGPAATEKLAEMQVTAQQQKNNVIPQAALPVDNTQLNSGSTAPSASVKEDNNSNADGIVKDANPVADAGTQKPESPAKPDIEKPVTITKEKKFYIGAFVAPEYTTIKYQPGNKVGFNFGGLLGYSFSKSLALEVGISTDKKYYTTDGKYFNSNQKWLEQAGKLLTLSGYSSLTEFPVNIKYSFKPSRDGNFFASAGLVSYIVHEENYNYEFDKGGFIYHKDKSSRNSTTSVFSNVNISAGYESSLGNFCNFRIEPYYRIPVKGIGVGSLPITSVGLNIGITKKIGFGKK